MCSMATKNKKPVKASRCSRSLYTESDIEEAIRQHEELGISIRAAARNHDIPEATLRHKISGYHPLSKKMGPPMLLTDAEEKVLVNYILLSCDRARPVTKHNVLNAVATILSDERERGYKRVQPAACKEIPGEKWWRNFRQRHPNIVFRTPESLTTSRKNVSKPSVYQWFEDTNSYFLENNLSDALEDPSRNYNMDESGFSLSPKQGRVLARYGEKAVFEEASAHQKTNITVLAIVCADGRVPPPMIIYPRKRINPMMTEEFPTDYEFTVGKSDKGYITYETLYEYLTNSFNNWLTTNNIQRPVILWTDWHETRNNYFLAKTLNEQQIILYGLPPNTTHFLQPLDVSVFGPLKKGWSKEAKQWEIAHSDEVITQVNFAKVFLPAYQKYVTPENIISGFAKCGLVPFNPDSPDYSKLKAGPAQRTSDTFIFEGVDQGGKVEMSTQTDPPHVFNKGVQTEIMQQVMTPREWKKVSYEGSLCDMIVDYAGYSSIREYYYNSLPLHTSQPHFQGSQRPSAPSSAAYVASVSSPSDSSTPTPGSSQCNPGQDQGNTQLPISHAFRCFNFYPERRAGKGPKKVKTVLDRVYAISSSKMVEELQRQRNEKQSQEEEKQRKLAEKQSKQKKSTGPKRKVPRTRPTKKICAPPATEDTDSNSSDELAIEEIVNNSSDDSIDIDDGGDFGIKLPLEDPQQYSWVGVKVDKVQPSTSGRAQTSSFEIYIGKVLEVNDDGGFTVSFLKQKTDTFYFFPQIEDVSCPVHKDEMVVIDSPISQVQNRLMGFVFPSGIKLSCKSYFQKY